MQMLRAAWVFWVAASAWSLSTHAAESDVARRDHVSVQLIAADRVATPGSTTLVALRLVHDPEWHTYWLNPGDSGLPTKLQWTLPQDVEAASIDWPAPHRIEIGSLVNFGYEGELVLPVRITLPPDLATSTRLPLEAKASWLVCQEECIPGDATLSLTLDIGDRQVSDPRWTGAFATAAAVRPTSVAWPTHWIDGGDTIDLLIEDAGAIADPASVEIFPYVPTLIAHARGTAERLDDGRLRVRTRKSDSFAMPDSDVGVLVASGHDKNRQLFAATAKPGAAGARTADNDPAVAALTPSSFEQPTIALALLLALAGGVLLNLMPCVLPVLSLKALALAQHAHDRPRARAHGLLYLAGTLSCFIALASVLLSLRAVGESIGWGFQLQTPWVIAALAVLMSLMGLSLSGAFQIGAGWMGVGQQLAAGDSARSAFFSGTLAAIVASPCTAPFMGPALGFAVTQPAPIALSIFAALALGLSLPIVALSFAPALARWLPRPGAWMERLKQLLAYPLYLTAIWLLWVLGRQLGTDGMALALLGMLATVLGIWLWQSGEGRIWGRLAATTAFAGAVFSIASLGNIQTTTAAPTRASAAHEPWSADRFDALRASGEPVLVNMTAAWCITCLANERVALSSTAVQQRLRTLGITYLKGDWTHRDAEITTYLAGFGRSGVPLYVLYPRGAGAPEILPQVLTPAIVDAALQRASGRDLKPSSSP
jgi:thiol:disulfide interchange protein/DsbC/DsbD-like thiol-disulfide interchange protein